ncbi:uncharacterized protein LOC108683031 [Hyalella azteca]|uniref:Uncharacterized protein LOC108683031 n=1 Tax=Hyalella azteca TaxID=294128 RepID=A0A8B7PRD4_HYAAZ|nr:uncharacterized protein LOC108683031 [Hyalella azteca]
MAAVMRIILAVSFAGFCLLAGGALAERQPRHMLDRPKLVHNALDAPVYPVCSVGGRQAACLRSEACTSQGGRFTGFCAGDPTLVCCVVEKTCDDETSAHSVTFRNPSFPLENLRPRLCPLMIKVGRDICSMRVDMNVFELEPATKSGCIFDMFVILGTVEGPTASLCGNMTGFATTFAVKELSDVTLSLVAQAMEG